MMPAGVTLASVAAVLLPIAVVTVLLRQLPFNFIKTLGDSPLVSLLGLTMPVGVMTVLVVYAAGGLVDAPSDLLPVAIGVAATAALHLWRRSAGLSIFVGTAVYMILVNLVF